MLTLNCPACRKQALPSAAISPRILRHSYRSANLDRAANAHAGFVPTTTSTSNISRVPFSYCSSSTLLISLFRTSLSPLAVLSLSDKVGFYLIIISLPSSVSTLRLIISFRRLINPTYYIAASSSAIPV